MNLNTLPTAAVLLAIDDGIIESTERVRLALEESPDYQLDPRSEAEILIFDNDMGQTFGRRWWPRWHF